MSIKVELEFFSVAEKLPEREARVLIVFGDGTTECAQYPSKSGGGFFSIDSSPVGATHWAYLPTLPVPDEKAMMSLLRRVYNAFDDWEAGAEWLAKRRHELDWQAAVYVIGTAEGREKVLTLLEKEKAR